MPASLNVSSECTVRFGEVTNALQHQQARDLVPETKMWMRIRRVSSVRHHGIQARKAKSCNFSLGVHLQLGQSFLLLCTQVDLYVRSVAA